MLLRITIVVEPDGDGFHAYCPAFKGVHMDGPTEQVALERMTEGLSVYLDSLERHGDPLPIGPGCRIEGEDTPALSPSFLREVDVPWARTA